eukprot:1377405-Pyramimonas_sp.AAC.1
MVGIPVHEHEQLALLRGEEHGTAADAALVHAGHEEARQADVRELSILQLRGNVHDDPMSVSRMANSDLGAGRGKTPQGHQRRVGAVGKNRA